MRWICLILICLGILISGYLLIRHFAIADFSAQSGADFCSTLFGTGCDDALRSPLAIQLGIPLAGWGLVYYGSLFSLLLLGWFIGDTFRFEATTAALLLAIASALGSIILFIVMITDISPFCPLCAIVHVNNILLLYPLKRLTGHSSSQLIRIIIRTVKYFLGGKTADPLATRWKLVGFLVSGLVAVVIYQWIFVEYKLHTRQASFNPQQTIAIFESGAQQEIPVSVVDPQLGDINATVRMVVFNDFQCPGCKQLSQTIIDLAEKFGDNLHIVFKHFPLDSTCNSLVKKELHPGACRAAMAAEAAHEQGKFWAYHKIMFESDSQSKITMKTLAENLELNFEHFETYRQSETALAKVHADIELGIELGVDGTPCVFINGRRAYDTRSQVLQLLINHEIKKHLRNP